MNDQIILEEFRRADDPNQERVYYPVGWYDRDVELFSRFDAAKQAKNAALQPARDRLEMARLDYAEAVRDAPEVAEATQAKADLTEFRKWVWAKGYTFPHPDKLIPHQEG
jgi:hypothetical protein